MFRFASLGLVPDGLFRVSHLGSVVVVLSLVGGAARAQVGPFPPYLGGYYWRGNSDHSGDGSTGDWSNAWYGGRWQSDGAEPPTIQWLPAEDGDGFQLTDLFVDQESAGPHSISLSGLSFPSSGIGISVAGSYSGGALDFDLVDISTTSAKFGNNHALSFNGTGIAANRLNIGAAAETISFDNANVSGAETTLTGVYDYDHPQDHPAPVISFTGSTFDASLLKVSQSSISQGNFAVDFTDSTLTGLGYEIGFGAENNAAHAAGLRLDNSLATIDQFLLIGSEGGGRLQLQNSSTLFANSAYVNVGQQGEGDLHVTTSSTLESNLLNVGVANTGSVAIDNDGTITTQTGVVGVLAGKEGTVNIQDDGEWHVHDLTVGQNGRGYIYVRNDGTLRIDGDAVLGKNEGSRGILNLIGADSHLEISAGGSLLIGDEGAGEVNLSEKAVFTSQGGVNLGVNDGSSATVTVDGEETTWLVQGDLNIGDSSLGRVEIRNQGKVEFTGSEVVVGNHGRGDGTLIIDGEGSGITGTGNVAVAKQGKGTLEIRNGAGIEIDEMTIGDEAESMGSILVTGRDAGLASAFETVRGLIVGNHGRGTFTISAGARALAGGDAILAQTGTASAELNVSDGGALSFSGDLVVGKVGIANVIIDGGVVKAEKSVIIGDDEGSSGTFTVKGLGGTFQMSAGPEVVTIGRLGTGKMVVSDSAFVTVKRDLKLATEHGSFGTLEIRSEAQYDAGNVEVGLVGKGTVILDSASLTTEEAQLGGGASAPAAAAATVEMSDSRWTSKGKVHLGLSSTVNLVNNSSLVVNGVGDALTIDGTTSRPAKLTVDDASDVEVTSSIALGQELGFGELLVYGGTVKSFHGAVQSQNSNVESKIAMSADSTWTNSGPLEVGTSGRGLVSVESGAAIEQVSTLTLGSLSGVGRLNLDDASSSVWGSDLKVRSGLARVLGGSLNFTRVEIDPAVGMAEVFLDGPSSRLTAFDVTVQAGPLSFLRLQNDGGAHTRSATINGAVSVVGGGRFTIGTSSDPAPPGAVQVSAGGTLSGTGRIFGNLIVKKGGFSDFRGGVFKPGRSPGTFTVEGDFTVEDDALVEIEIGGLAPGQHDLVDVTGTTTIAGDVVMKFVDGFAPSLGDEFTVFSADVLDITPSMFVRNLAPGWEYSVSPAAGVDGAWTITSLSDGVFINSADFNADGHVDGADLDIWKTSMTVGTPFAALQSQGDADADLDVDGADFLVWQRQYGLATASLIAVPEPTAVTLFVGLAASLVVCRGQRR